MVTNTKHEGMIAMLPDLTAEEKKDATPWVSCKLKDLDYGAEMTESRVISERYVGPVEALWTLVASATLMRGLLLLDCRVQRRA